MNILLWGLGYVGSVSAACFANLGHKVIGVEINPAKVEAINNGKSAIKEPGLGDLINEMVTKGSLRAVRCGQDLVSWADLSLICVGTPNSIDGNQMNDQVRNVAQDIGIGLKSASRYHVVIVRSTVFPGTTRHEIIPILEKFSGLRVGQDFGTSMNPEFLREASAINDFYHPPYTIVGEFDSQSGSVVEQLYQDISAPVVRVTLEEAEIVKLVNNSFHALKVGFANEIGRICNRLGIDSHVVMQLVCADRKLNISPAYMKPGFAFGGSCLPKDLRSLTFHAQRLKAEVPILESILPSNNLQIEEAHIKIHKTGANNVGILGLSFKPYTDDLRESPVINLIRALWQEGVNVLVYDPDIELDNMLGSNLIYLERQLPQIEQILCSSLEDVLKTCQTLVVTQKRSEFVKALESVQDSVEVLDLVRLFNTSHLPNLTNYSGISW